MSSQISTKLHKTVTTDFFMTEERHNKYVHDYDFANLVAWFGPVKTGTDGLFHKVFISTQNQIVDQANFCHKMK